MSLPTPAKGASIVGDTPCPNADGSSPRTTSFAKAPPTCIVAGKTYTADLQTSKGLITIALDAEAAPNTVNNFVVLARYHYFDTQVFHRIIPGFVVQGGSPDATGTGGPGYSFADELPSENIYVPGAVTMANSGRRQQREPVLHRVGRRQPPGAQLFVLRQGHRGHGRGRRHRRRRHPRVRCAHRGRHHPVRHHQGVLVATECPPADGSAPKTQRFKGPPPMCIDPEKKYTATMETTKGTMVIALDPARAPKTVNNFVVLARYHYYDGVSFHRIIPGFVIQGGDPEGTGRGGPGYKFEDELPRPGQYEIGSLAMANAGPDTNGSQFFIITGHHGASLPPNYSLFGKVVSGIDVVQALNAVGSPGAGTPKEKVGMISVTIAEE